MGKRRTRWSRQARRGKRRRPELLGQADLWGNTAPNQRLSPEELEAQRELFRNLPPDVSFKINKTNRNELWDASTDGHSLTDLHTHWAKSGFDPGQCHYCDTPLTNVPSTGDHVVPISRGGTDTLDNLVPCCRSCNTSKGVRLLHTEWTPPNKRPKNRQLDLE